MGGYHWGYYWWPLALVAFLVLVWLFAFFRDPEREVPAEEHVMVSPADGTVSDITEVAHDELLGGPAVRVGIFLSVFNVHINRSPCDGKVLSIDYKKGKFLNALKHAQASEENESNTVVLGEPTTGRPVAVVKQIVGLIARRIIFTASDGDSVRRGDRIGMIKFGSRTELSIPKWLAPEVTVKEGQIRPRGGRRHRPPRQPHPHDRTQARRRRGVRAAGAAADADLGLTRLIQSSPRRPRRARRRR